MFYNNNWLVTKYKESTRIPKVYSLDEYIENYETIIQKSSYVDLWSVFFENFRKLFLNIGFPATYQFFWCENTKFADVVHESKNVYLSFFVTTWSQNILYSLSVKQNSNSVFNSIFVSKSSQNIYSSVSITESFNIFFSQWIYNSNNIRFSKNLTWCFECIACSNLENQSYCIKNQKFTREEYIDKKNEIMKWKDRFSSIYNQLFKIHFQNHNSINCVWWSIVESENIDNWLYIYNIKNSWNVIMQASDIGWKNIYDSILWGSWETYDLYASIGAWICNHLYSSIQCGTCTNMFYSMFCESSSFCLGCIGLKNKSYCILNKQYTKEERYEKVDEIFADMEAEWTLGQFFPATMNPFYFNDTAAYLINPTFTKEEVAAKGYLWRDEAIKVDIPEWAKVISINELANYERRIDNPDSDNQKWFIDPEILKVIIQDEQGNVYRIVKMEYDFLMKHGLPLPRKHRLERMKENFRIQ